MLEYHHKYLHTGKTTSAIRFKLYAKRGNTACNLTKGTILAMGLR